jgi:hypothetical protein
MPIAEFELIQAFIPTPKSPPHYMERGLKSSLILLLYGVERGRG